MARLLTLFWLGTKELRSIQHDALLILLILYSFSAAIYTQATGSTSGINHASIAFVDEDRSVLSRGLLNAFHPPRFQTPVLIAPEDIDRCMGQGQFLFVVAIPPRFEADVRTGRRTAVQINLDATASTQASFGNHDIQAILGREISRYLTGSEEGIRDQAALVLRTAYNPNHDRVWYNAIISLINQITVVAVILTGAALLREREHGTIEHLLAMPLAPFDIALAKLWANGLVILAAVTCSLVFLIQRLLAVPLAGSVPLFLAGTAIYLFCAMALGVFLGTLARSMAQFALLALLVLVTMQMLSGGQTPVESQPAWLQRISICLPTRHFVQLSQDILFRGAGLKLVWPEFLIVAVQGLALISVSLICFRRSISGA
jgi:ABC-2 type transport system permease protein